MPSPVQEEGLFPGPFPLVRRDVPNQPLCLADDEALTFNDSCSYNYSLIVVLYCTALCFVSIEIVMYLPSYYIGLIYYISRIMFNDTYLVLFP